MSKVRRGRKASQVAGTGLPVDFDREICANLEAAEQREWLVTNGIGGFASGTVAGLVTRRYHSLLMASLKPPLGRTLLVTKIDEIAEYGAETFPLGANRWVGGANPADRKSTRLNSSHSQISYAVFCLKKKKKKKKILFSFKKKKKVNNS